MTTENIQPTDNAMKSAFIFGTKLKSKRESMGFDKKDVASQLRLSENVIDMLEKDTYPNDLPITFVRGYIRLYGKFLQMPDYEIKAGLEPIKPIMPPETIMQAAIKQEEPVTISNYSMQAITALIVLTLASLVGIWWYNHNKAPITTPQETKALPLTIETAEPQTVKIVKEPTPPALLAAPKSIVIPPLAPTTKPADIKPAAKPAKVAPVVDLAAEDTEEE